MKNMRIKDVIRALGRQGCRAIRTRGSHQTWRTPSGRVFVLVVNHPGEPISRCVLQSVGRVLELEGIEVGRTSRGSR